MMSIAKHAAQQILPGVLAIVFHASIAAGAQPPVPQIKNAGFEAELAGTWDNGALGPAWWNSNGCKSEGTIDRSVHKYGTGSLHLRNLSGRSPHVYGTTSQPLEVLPNQRYRISLWARANQLTSNGAVLVIVDPEWKIRPIALPKGSYEWTRLESTFSLPDANAQVRILIEDTGEAWIDELKVEPLDPALARRAELADAVQQFRQTALTDFSKAVSDWGSPTTVQKVAALNAQLWPESEPRTGWSYLINLSLLITGNADAEPAVVAFYHPWCDLFVVTVWSAGPTRFLLADVEVLMGELARSRGRALPTPVPEWLRKPSYRPAALARLTAESVAALESISMNGGLWQRAIPSVLDKEVQELNYRGCALLLTNGMSRVQDYYVSRPDEPSQLPGLRAAAGGFLQMAASGKIDQALRLASETPKASAEALAQTPKEDFKNLMVASTVLAEPEDLVFLVSPRNPSGFISLHLDGPAGALRLKRVDVISFDAACQEPAVPSPALGVDKK